MSNNKFYIDEIRRVIKSSVSPCYENTAKTELYVRCPHCGDSKKSKTSAHFYIQMKPPFLCFCQKCGYTAQLNRELLEKLQIYNSNVVDIVNDLNNNNKTSNNYNTQKRKKVLKLTYNEKLTDNAKKSLDYLNNRFKVNETLDSLKKFNIICDPIQFFKYLYEEMHLQVSYNPRFNYYESIGFLSLDKKYLITRSIEDSPKLRYTNTSLSNDDDKSKMFMIQNKIDVMSPSIKLVITEGAFDAIGIYYKKYRDVDNVIIAAACGKSFEQVILFFIKYGLLNLDIEIYSDADVDITYYKDIKKKNKIISNYSLKIFYNTLEKDCGTSSDRINLKEYKI